MIEAETVIQLLLGIGYGIGWAGYGYITNRARAGKDSSFNRTKFVSTIVLGAAVAVGLFLGTQQFDELTFQQTFFIYAGAIPVFDRIINIFLDDEPVTMERILNALMLYKGKNERK